MSSKGCAQTDWVWSEHKDIPHYIKTLFEADDIEGVVMVAVSYTTGGFTRAQLDSASEDMLGFVGFDFAPQQCLVFDPSSENLIYNPKELIAEYKSQAQKFLKDADRIEILYVENTQIQQSLVCGQLPKTSR